MSVCPAVPGAAHTTCSVASPPMASLGEVASGSFSAIGSPATHMFVAGSRTTCCSPSWPEKVRWRKCCASTAMAGAPTRVITGAASSLAVGQLDLYPERYKIAWESPAISRQLKCNTLALDQTAIAGLAGINPLSVGQHIGQ